MRFCGINIIKYDSLITQEGTNVMLHKTLVSTLQQCARFVPTHRFHDILHREDASHRHSRQHCFGFRSSPPVDVSTDCLA